MKYYGKVGYGFTVEKKPGVWVDEIIEHFYYGDVISNARQLTPTENLNADITVNNSISIVADPYANLHFFAIKYIEWAGTLWSVPDVKVQTPRLILRLGGVYNGPTGTAA